MIFFVIVIIAFVMFILTRILLILLSKILLLVFKEINQNPVERDFGMSMVFLLMYVSFYVKAMEVINKTNIIGNFDWYLIYTFIGITCVLWIYFKWEFSMFVPRIELDKKTLAIKKIVIFTIVMLTSFCYGYAQILKITDGKEIEALTLVANYTIIPGIIALDRVMNQVICLIEITKAKRENMIKSV